MSAVVGRFSRSQNKTRVVLSIRVSNALHENLSKAADEMHVSMATIVELALEEYLFSSESLSSST